ncbi:MAG: ATP-binding cassette domain-containing protein, partial [Syntrophobacterales bacterium]
MPIHHPRDIRLRALGVKPAAEELITLDNVTLRLRDRRILAGTSWSIRRGEHWAVIGPNGAGKTTLVRALRGEVPVVQGKIFPADPWRLQELVACVSFENHRRLIEQESRQDEARCFSGNADGATTAGQLLEDVSRPLADAGAHLIERLGVGRLLYRDIRTLSNGEVQRVLIARALLAAPQVLVLDEPFDGLDLPACENLAAMVAALMNNAGAVVLVTHRLSQIPAQVTHVMGIRAGQVLFQGLRAETLTPENIAELYQGVEKQASGRQPRRAAFWEAQPIQEYVSIYNSRTTLDNGLKCSFSTPCYGGPLLEAAPAPRPEPCLPIPREPLVEFRNVTVSYGGKPVLKNLNWSMRAGEHWALCGPNGSGKTTVVNLIAGENPQVYASDVRLFGRRRGSGDSIHDIRRRLGFMSCEFHLRHTRRLTAFEVVLSGFFDSVGLYRTADARQAESGRGLMEALGIGGLTGRAFPHLSFGEQRMVLLARAVVKLPELLVLDEPCQGLDPFNRRRVIE